MSTRSEISTGQWLGKPLSPACERAHVLITRHIDGELARSDVRDLRAHLATCTICRRALETQAAQSQLLADSLKALWAADDASLKKKVPTVHELWLGLRRAWPRISTCIALVACVLLFATRVTAPSGASIKQQPPGAAVESPSEPRTSISSKTNVHPKQLESPRTPTHAEPSETESAQNGPQDYPLEEIAPEDATGE